MEAISAATERNVFYFARQAVVSLIIIVILFASLYTFRICYGVWKQSAEDNKTIWHCERESNRTLLYKR
jgi:formate hydrogenlyase subunit 3/multisubunit Na+/H+ antiporter MnhD subunit